MAPSNNADAARTPTHDLVLFGATGFTGRLVAEYLLRHRAPLRWALAGRDHDKLLALRRELASVDPAAESLPLLVGDARDPASVDAMVRQTRVVCTTVGPYARHGVALVAACAQRGVHYCDLTGEPQFMRRSIDAHHARAAADGTRIVHACGFDSIPSDLGVLLLHEHFRARGTGLSAARLRVRGMKGGASGGSIASGLELIAQRADPAVRRLLDDPYALDPSDGERGLDGPDPRGPRQDPDTGRWTAPFVMALVNTRVVRRSNALMGYPYGRDFRYDEAVELGAGPASRARATVISAGMWLGETLLASPWSRRLAARALPKPGQGPDASARAAGYFRVEVRGRARDGTRATATIVGTSDPGYGETAKMLGESALCLALDPLATPGGVITPAVAMGLTLVERLRAAGMSWRVD